MKKIYIVSLSSIFLVIVFILGAYIYKKQQVKRYGFMARENVSTFVREYSPTLGSDDAKVYLIKFTDPGCETCRDFHPLVKQLMAANPGKIKLVIRYAPFHQGADTMVKILEAARKQGKFWETLEVMYRTQGHWASHHKPQPQKIWSFLHSANLDLRKIRTDMKNPEFVGIINQDLADAKTLNVRKTPGFFVNGKPLTTFGYQQLKNLVESEIRDSY